VCVKEAKPIRLGTESESYKELAWSTFSKQAIPLNEGEGFKIWGKIYTALHDPAHQANLTLQLKRSASIHEMSSRGILETRMYLHLTPDSLERVTLITNPKANSTSKPNECRLAFGLYCLQYAARHSQERCAKPMILQVQGQLLKMPWSAIQETKHPQT